MGIGRIWYVLLGELGSSRLSYPLHRAIYRLSGGRILGSAFGCPVVLLTTTGRKSGRPCTTPLYGFRDERIVVVVASNAGKARHPSWFLNLQAEPACRVQLGREVFQARAREAGPDERARLWPRLVERYAGYEAYRERTDRPIPVVLLELA